MSCSVDTTDSFIYSINGETQEVFTIQHAENYHTSTHKHTKKQRAKVAINSLEEE